VDIVTEVIISLSLSRARACDEGDVHGGGRHVIEGCIGWLNPTGSVAGGRARRTREDDDEARDLRFSRLHGCDISYPSNVL
jgi:hypothetical protein